MGCCNNPNYQSRAARESINNSTYQACQCATEACECKDVAVQAQIMAEASQESAAGSANQAQAAWNDFQARYMGAYASAPTTTITGALYFDTTTNQMFVWDGSVWIPVSASTGAAYLGNNQTFTGTNIFSVNSATTALRITQTGTGESFRVEDETNPDSTPFVISNAGTVHIGTTGTANFLNTALEVSSTSKGFLPPRMSTFFRNFIVTPPDGLIIYNTTTNKINIYNGTSWVEIEPIPSNVAYINANQTFTGDNIFSVNNSTNAIKITQIGSGNALLVEDSNPDTSPFVVTGNGKVGIGINPPIEKLEILDNNNFGTVVAIENISTGGRRWTIYSTGLSNAEGAGKLLIRDSTFGQVRMTIDTLGNVGIGTTSPNSAAALEVNSTTKGLLLPRMSEAQRDLISNPPQGLIIYNTTANGGLGGIDYFNGSTWNL